jgi:acyl carrier protein
MTRLQDELRALVGRQLGRPKVALDDRLVEDLGADSMDLVTIAAVVEESYRVRLEEERLPLLRTVRDIEAELDRLRGARIDRADDGR